MSVNAPFSCTGAHWVNMEMLRSFVEEVAILTEQNEAWLLEIQPQVGVSCCVGGCGTFSPCQCCCPVWVWT